MPDIEHRSQTGGTTQRARRVTVRVTCRSCLHEWPSKVALWQLCLLTNTGLLIDQRKGDVPLVRLRWRCTECGSRRTDMLIMPNEAVLRP